MDIDATNIPPCVLCGALYGANCDCDILALLDRTTKRYETMHNDGIAATERRTQPRSGHTATITLQHA